MLKFIIFFRYWLFKILKNDNIKLINKLNINVRERGKYYEIYFSLFCFMDVIKKLFKILGEELCGKMNFVGIFVV